MLLTTTFPYFSSKSLRSENKRRRPSDNKERNIKLKDMKECCLLADQEHVDCAEVEVVVERKCRETIIGRVHSGIQLLTSQYLNLPSEHDYNLP